MAAMGPLATQTPTPNITAVPPPKAPQHSHHFTTSTIPEFDAFGMKPQLQVNGYNFARRR